MAETSPPAPITNEPQAAAEAAEARPSEDGGNVETYSDADPFEGKPMTPKRGSTLRMIRKMSAKVTGRSGYISGKPSCADPTADAKLEADDDASLASSEEARGDDTGMTDDDSVETTAPWSCWEILAAIITCPIWSCMLLFAQCQGCCAACGETGVCKVMSRCWCTCFYAIYMCISACAARFSKLVLFVCYGEVFEMCTPSAKPPDQAEASSLMP
mmetsp:Transcript_64068/g.177027  ORF Transcript_64068/g.177027 Transcript_64068/m.177027 type:complete len:215 (-) Transcript_64068:479-1123(-)|eukprot:CAMPEP_0119535436 /NCGR_PEP_ID=MMETSP1344-20130328/48467_1 /TAXON_ID=236787 /ORGANISM="Florenciella parvula, Strain CCMP2471" /LENGTH=214 /DNA_ID=CAMNT_0007577055 /DNA_START=165 /DNA_END=809 /DNA_ORIENTATION=+